MPALDRNHWLKGFQGLDGSLETDGSRVEAVFACCLSDNRPDEIVGQQVRPDFLPHQFRCLAPQDFHLHRLFQRSQIELGVPARAIKLREIVLGELVCVQQRRGDDERLDPKARLLDSDARFADREKIGKRLVGLPIHRAGAVRFGPLDDMIVFAQALSTAKVGRTFA